MRRFHLRITILATIILTNGCSPLSTATRRTGHMVRVVAIDAPLHVASSLYEAVGRIDGVGAGLSPQAQFEHDASAGGDTTAKVIDRQLK